MNMKFFIGSAIPGVTASSVPCAVSMIFTAATLDWASNIAGSAVMNHQGKNGLLRFGLNFSQYIFA